MATIGAIAAMRDSALKRLAAAIEHISEAANLEPAKLPTFNRDPDYLHADQLRVLADWAERVAEWFTPTVEALEDFSRLSVTELKALADERGVDLAGATRKADIIAALEAAAPAETPEEPAE